MLKEFGFCINQMENDKSPANYPERKKQQIKSKRRNAVIQHQHEQIEQPFSETMKRFRKNCFLREVKYLHGRHSAIHVKKGIDFKEQWQTHNSYGVEESSYSQLIHSETMFTYMYTGLILASYLIMFWGFSTFRILSMERELSVLALALLGLIVIGVDAGVKLRLTSLNTTQTLEFKNILLEFKSQLVLCFYCILNAVCYFCQPQNQKIVLFFIDAIAITLIYLRAKTLFWNLKVRSYTSAFKHKMKLLDLLGTLMLNLHVFGILLYCASYYDEQQNWTLKVNNGEPIEGTERYFYAFYFAATTMLTIGYGDLSPTNKVEVLAILPVQIIGVAVFSYIINEIGYTVGAVRKEEETLEHNLSTLSEMSTFYQMDPELANVAKEHLISNQKSISKIYPEDENKVCQKLSDQLRQTIVTTNGLNIVKSSIFFLCHWTKRFQIEAAKKLTKKVLHPNEMVTQLPGKERLYVVRSGRLDVFTNCSSNYKQQFKRLLKTISPKLENISDNVYGYTSMISNRLVRLAAVSKDFTSVYFMEKQEFMNCVNESQLDREYYFEMKTKINESPCCERWETPAVLNIREHYSPSPCFVLKRFISSLGKAKNSRKSIKRRSRRLIDATMPLRVDQVLFNSIGTDVVIEDFPYVEKSLRSISPEHSIERDMLEPYTEEKIDLQFETVKEYHNFFRSNNLTSVLSKYERKNPEMPKRNHTKVDMWKHQYSVPSLQLNQRNTQMSINFNTV